MADHAQDVAQRIAELREQVNDHAYRYYVLDAPIISDAEYDQLYRELERLEGEHPELVTPQSPTQKVGGPILPYFETVSHEVPMLSLENAVGEEDLRAFDKRLKKLLDADPDSILEYECEPKLDGLAVSIDYTDGLFVRGATRGDGTTGENVTENIRTIKGLALQLRQPFTGTVRGEVFIRKADFIQLNERRVADGEEPYANPRNTAAGAVRQLDSSIASSRPLSIYLYSLLKPEIYRDASGAGVGSQSQVMQFLSELGLPTNRDATTCRGIEEVWRYCQRMGERRELYLGEDEGALPYEIDGVVVKLNDLTRWENLGYTAKSPRFMIAFKWPETAVQTRLNAVTFQISRSGVFSPVAELEPVQLGGVTVSRATLHNLDEIARLGVMIGDEVSVKRGGEVIPKIVSIAVPANDRRRIDVPHECSYCGTKLVLNERAHNWACPNRRCSGRLVERLAYFGSRGVMDIEGFSRKTAEKLVTEKLVKDLPDLYELKSDALLGLEGFAEVSVDNLLDAIKATRRQPLWRVISALEIPQVGSQTAKLLAREFRSLDALSAADPERLTQINGIGDVMAKDIVDWFADSENQSLVASLTQAGLAIVEEPGSQADSPLAGKSFVLTGTVEGITREELGSRLEAQGAAVKSSVSKKTDYVLAGDSPGSKRDKAEKLGVRILEGQDLLDFLAEHSLA